MGSSPGKGGNNLNQQQVLSHLGLQPGVRTIILFKGRFPGPGYAGGNFGK
jgi:hypothetical protein